MEGRESLVKQITSKLDSLRNRKKEKEPQTPEQIAKEAFLLVSVAGPAGQKPIAEYRVDFDIQQHNPGTVLRLETKNGHGHSLYSWFAIGKSDKNEVKVYTPRHKDLHIDAPQLYLNFSLEDGVSDTEISTPYFPISDAMVTLYPTVGFKNTKPEDYPKIVDGIKYEWADIYHPTKIEIIHAGYALKEKTKVKVSTRSVVLNPSLQKS